MCITSLCAASWHVLPSVCCPWYYCRGFQLHIPHLLTFSLLILFNNFIKILNAIYDCCIKYFKRRWWPDFVVSILVTTFVKNTCKSFNKIDSSWIFSCTRVTVNLTNQPRPGECTFKTSGLCDHSTSIAPFYLQYMNYSTFNRKNAQCSFYYQAQIHVYTYLIFSRRFLCWRFLHLFIWTLCIRFICCRLLVSKKHVLSPFTIIIIIIPITTVFSSSSSSSSSSVITHVAHTTLCYVPLWLSGEKAHLWQCLAAYNRLRRSALGITPFLEGHRTELC